ncbi:unnamed protein product, partial [Closterium sp. NIES-54]
FRWLAATSIITITTTTTTTTTAAAATATIATIAITIATTKTTIATTKTTIATTKTTIAITITTTKTTIAITITTNIATSTTMAITIVVNYIDSPAMQRRESQQVCRVTACCPAAATRRQRHNNRPDRPCGPVRSSHRWHRGGGTFAAAASPRRSLRFPLHVAARATNDWDKANLLGAGSFGDVYKGVLPLDGTLWAVKRAKVITSDFKREVQCAWSSGEW